MITEDLKELARCEARAIVNNSVFQQIGFSKSSKFDQLSAEDVEEYLDVLKKEMNDYDNKNN